MTQPENQAEALKPCPFCGGTFVAQGASRDYISVWCGNCGARGPEVKFPENCMPGPPVDECRAEWNRRAFLPEAPAVPVGVKALEWEEIHQRRSDEDPTTEVVGWEAEAKGFACSCIVELTGGGASMRDPDYEEKQFDDPESAKAAAQADFEARINSALQSSPPVKAAAVDGEALRKAFEAARYQPGDHPVVPVKIAAFMKEVERILSLAARGEPKP